MERISDEIEPAYNLEPELVTSSTAGLISEVDRLYNEGEKFAFVAWRPHWMKQVYDFKYLEDPKDALGELSDSAMVLSIANENLPDDDPVAYAFTSTLTLTEDQVNEIEFEIKRPASGVGWRTAATLCGLGLTSRKTRESFLRETLQDTEAKARIPECRMLPRQGPLEKGLSLAFSALLRFNIVADLDKRKERGR